ncbi:MAG: VacJ family lipoprotein [Deltaproteobacteria bacterium]|nr:VacJ family lipoprotein [Deltaproteobacteria bacterium]
MSISAGHRSQWVLRVPCSSTLVVLLITLGCASSPNTPTPDTLESLNRPVFGANQTFDKYAFRPVARGWKAVTPKVMRRSISNSYRNLTFPKRFVSNMGQGEVRNAHVELARFLVNSTLGIGGLFDPATRLGLGKYDEDIGTMLARWGVPSGPYLVIPVLGPSTPRDSFGDVVALALNPLLWAGVSIPPLGLLFAINGRAEMDDQIEASRRVALDYYVFVRDAFIQSRTRTEYVTREESPPGDLYDLYDLPEAPPLVLPQVACDGKESQGESQAGCDGEQQQPEPAASAAGGA